MRLLQLFGLVRESIFIVSELQRRLPGGGGRGQRIRVLGGDNFFWSNEGSSIRVCPHNVRGRYSTYLRSKDILSVVGYFGCVSTPR